jgi:triosephosphate isomerase
MLKTPLIIVNFKTYVEATGERAVRLAKLIAGVAKRKKVNVAVALQAFDIHRVAEVVDIPVLAQHVDPLKSGRFTGWNLPEAAKKAGAVGSLVNHSERALTMPEIELVVRRLRELRMTSVVCGRDVERSMEVARLAPDIVAVEPPELIGTGRAVSKVKPEVISDTVREVRRVNPRIKVLCGAGIASGEDVYLALKLGAEGVLLARAVTCAENPRAAIENIIDGVVRFKKEKHRASF